MSGVRVIDVSGADVTDEALPRQAEDYGASPLKRFGQATGTRPPDGAKGWTGAGGGASTVEPWLVSVASALLSGQPRTATHACDLALKHWLAEPGPRAVIHYLRGEFKAGDTHVERTLPALASVVEQPPGWDAAHTILVAPDPRVLTRSPP